MNTYHPIVTLIPFTGTLTKRALASDIARLFDILGWCSPAVIKPKILLQRLWEDKLNWDDPVSATTREIWEKWRGELPELHQRLIPRYYFPKDSDIVSVQLHGFCDASESAYAGVVLRG